MKINLDPRDVIALEQQEPWIKRTVEAERDSAFAYQRAVLWSDEATRLRESVDGLTRNLERVRSQRNLAVLLAFAGIGAAVLMAVRG